MRLFLVIFCSTLVSGIWAERDFVLTSEDSSLVLNGYTIEQNYSKKFTVSTTCPNCVIQLNGEFTDAALVSFMVGKALYSSVDFVSGKLQVVGLIRVKSLGDPNYILSFTVANGSALVAPCLQNYYVQMGDIDTGVHYVLNATYPVITIGQPIDIRGLTMFLSEVVITEGCSLHVYSGGAPSKAGADKYRIASVSSADQSNWIASSIPVSAITLVVDDGCSGMATLRPKPDTNPSSDSVSIGSTGVIVSREYPGVFDTGVIDDQIMMRSFSAGKLVNFNIDVVAADAGTEGSLHMTVKGYKKRVWELMFTRNVRESTQKWIGKTFGVSWHPGQAPRKGFLIRYHITKMSPKPALLTSILLLVMMSFAGRN